MKQLFLLTLIILGINVTGQTIIGKWITFDDKTKAKKAVIEIYTNNNTYYAKIIENFGGPKNAICKECNGSKKNKPIVGLVIIEKLKQKKSEYVGGIILDPETGDNYDCQLELITNNILKVRGFLGFSLFGRTQYWKRKE